MPSSLASNRPPPAAPAAARTCVRTGSSTRQGRVLVGCRRTATGCASTSTTRPRHPALQAHAISRNFTVLDQGARVAAGWALGLSIVERIGRVSPQDRGRLTGRARIEIFREVPLSAAIPARRGARQGEVDRGQLAGLCVLCIDNEPTILDGMEMLLASGAAASSRRRPGVGTGRARREQTCAGCTAHRLSPRARRTASRHCAICAARFAGATAILITADRRRRGTRGSSAQSVQLLTSPSSRRRWRALSPQARVHRGWLRSNAE